ncbi:hypothetical protein [Cesiribacter sp. SM1]|uniref:hypothetical protein n=1 Tax=Cesiribacter sp. SM1 TaxID=2861196 RepID=UPI001CD297D6|nr:hypothetical protein [Cesiribacter sp. SM1]
MRILHRGSILVLFFIGFAALWGGIPLVLDPSGVLNQMQLSWLNGSPFSNYLIPGIFLCVAIGLFSLITAFSGMLHSRNYPFMCTTAGAILLAWLIVQLLIIPAHSLLQPLFMVLAIILLLTGILEKVKL